MQSILKPTPPPRPRCGCRAPLDRTPLRARSHGLAGGKGAPLLLVGSLGLGLRLRLRRSYATGNRSDRALMDELHRLSHRQQDSQPSLGPFLMPRGKMDERPPGIQEFLAWSQVGWSERFRRVFRMTRNLAIVSFGGGLGLLVIYSIASELFAPASTTNLMNMTITTLTESQKLNKILEQPIKFRTSSIPSQTVQNQTGTIELRFWVEAHRPNQAIKGDWKTIEWWKSLITPLITSQVSFQPQPNSALNNQSLEPTPNASLDKNHPGSSPRNNSWWPGLLRLVMPSTFGYRSSLSSADQRSWSDRFFPKHGSFEHGEVVAELIKESNGQWKYKTLVVDFPDSHNLKYRLDVADELRRRQKSIQQEQKGENNNTQNHTRYRFWNRRINL